MKGVTGDGFVRGSTRVVLIVWANLVLNPSQQREPRFLPFPCIGVGDWLGKLGVNVLVLPIALYPVSAPE